MKKSRNNSSQLLKNYSRNVAAQPPISTAQTTACTHLNGHIGAREGWLDCPIVVSDDRLNRSVQAWPEQEQAAQHDKNVENCFHTSPRAGEQVCPVHLPICDSEEDETKEGVESGTEETEEIL